MEFENLGERRPLPDGFTLKLLALVTMTIDHTAYVLGCGDLYWPMRYIGRIAFPIYCFLLVEGYYHTRHVGKYAQRLGVMALVSELSFDLMCAGHFPDLNHQNVMFTLLLGLMAMWLLDCGRKWVSKRVEQPALRQVLTMLFGIPMAYFLAMVGNWMDVDYHKAGVLLIVLFYLLRGHLVPLVAATALLLYHYYSAMEMMALVAFVPIALYNGQRGNIPCGKAGQWFFYWYYPLHIGVLVVIAAALGIQTYTFF